jgi:hypothetical protein
MVGGQQFTRPERTPFLRAIIDRAQAALQSEFDAVALDVQVKRDADLLLSTQAAVIPDLAVFRGPTSDVPSLVVEYRAESTDRLFFGPKRLAYARALVPELWFVDVSKATVTVLRLGEALDYPWPAACFTYGESFSSAALGDSRVATELLLP